MPDNPLASDLNHVLEHTRGLWDELRGEQLFITGGTGFFGSWLLESLLWANRQLGLGACATVLTRDPSAFRDRAPHLAEDVGVTLLAGDIRTFEPPAGTFNHVLHVATETAPDGGSVNPLQLFRTNLEGTLRILDLAQHCGARRLLFTSSGAVYGRQPADLTHIPEDYSGAPGTTDPNSSYGQAKRAAEHLLTIGASAGMETKIARCFAFVGPGLKLDANYAIGNFIRNALDGKPIHVKGDGTPHRSYLYAADLAIWLWTILLKGQHARPYNVGSDADLTIADVAREVAQEVSPGLYVEIADKPILAQPSQRYVPSIQRAKTELGLQVWVPLDAAVRRTADFYSR